MAETSIARAFYDSICKASEPFKIFQSWINANPPVGETEWREFKWGVLTDEKRKELWSKALSGFANTQGGVLIWGLECKKVGGVDQVGGFALVDSPHAIASRLMELHHQASDPPVLGVEVSSFSDPANPNKGVVVCFIPESPSRPHRAEYLQKQYYIRAGDDFVVPSVSLLRSLFVPTANARVVPIIESQLVDTTLPGRTRLTRIHFNCYARNTGLVSSEGALFALRGEYPGEFQTPQDWRKHDTASSPLSFASPRAIFPGETMQVFRFVYGIPVRTHRSPDLVFPTDFRLSFHIRIFSHNQTPIRGTVDFDQNEIVQGIKKSCHIEEIVR